MADPQGQDVHSFEFRFASDWQAGVAMQQLARANLCQTLNGTRIITLRALRFEVASDSFCLIHYAPGRFICFTLTMALVQVLQDGKVIWTSGQS